MKFILDNWYLVLTAVASGGALLWMSFSKSAAKGLSITDAVQLINKEKAAVIDIRDAAEFQKGHIKAAKNIPVASIEVNQKQLPSNKKTPLILVCNNGSQSVKAVSAFSQRGYEAVYTLAKGMSAWKEAELPIHKT